MVESGILPVGKKTRRSALLCLGDKTDFTKDLGIVHTNGERII